MRVVLELKHEPHELLLLTEVIVATWILFKRGGGSCDEFFVTKSILFSEHFRLKCIILLLLFSSMTENVLHVIYRPVFSALFLANEISDYCTICIIMTRSM